MAYPAELVVAAAADLAAAEKSIVSDFKRDTGIQVRLALGSSGLLAHQVENGAPYDVFLSANEQYMRDLERSGLIVAGSVRVYALGRLALWSKTGAYRRLEDLLGAEVRHVALPNPVHAPYGMAARQALGTQGLWERLKDRVVLAENVRQAYQYAESGNAEATLTAWSLVFDKGGVLIPDQLHQPIRQAGGVVASSGSRPAAQRFLEWLVSPAGQEILGRFGLSGPPKP